MNPVPPPPPSAPPQSPLPSKRRSDSFFPQIKLSKKMAVLAAIGLLLVVSLPVSIFLAQSEQDIRQEASGKKNDKGGGGGDNKGPKNNPPPNNPPAQNSGGGGGGGPKQKNNNDNKKDNNGPNNNKGGPPPAKNKNDNDNKGGGNKNDNGNKSKNSGNNPGKGGGNDGKQIAMGGGNKDKGGGGNGGNDKGKNDKNGGGGGGNNNDNDKNKGKDKSKNKAKRKNKDKNKTPDEEEWVDDCTDADGDGYCDEDDGEACTDANADAWCDDGENACPDLDEDGWCDEEGNEPGWETTNVSLAFNVLLHGIGKGGTVVNPEAIGNTDPQTKERDFTVALLWADDLSVIDERDVTLTYDTESGTYKGTIDYGEQYIGRYRIGLKTDRHLKNLTQLTTAIDAGTPQVTVQPISLDAGDVNGDGRINILDFHIIRGCYSDLLPAKDCNEDWAYYADLNDDGKVNSIDVQLYLIELTTKLATVNF